MHTRCFLVSASYSISPISFIMSKILAALGKPRLSFLCMLDMVIGVPSSPIRTASYTSGGIPPVLLRPPLPFSALFSSSGSTGSLKMASLTELSYTLSL